MEQNISSKMNEENALLKYTLRLADSNIIMGHRLSELCSSGPYLEEDIAISNIALDYLGQANSLYSYASEQDHKKRSVDHLVFHRDEHSYYNLLITEEENGHFGNTIAKILFYSLYQKHFYTLLIDSKDIKLAAIAEKSLKEVKYHVRHAKSWTIRLGDGTKESKIKMQEAINNLWKYTDEIFEMDKIDDNLIKEGVAVHLGNVKNDWQKSIHDCLKEATLELPLNTIMISGGKNGKHTGNLKNILETMQYLPRKYPDAKW